MSVRDWQHSFAGQTLVWWKPQSLARVEPLLCPAATNMMGNLAHAQSSTLTYTPGIKRVLIVTRMSPR